MVFDTVWSICVFSITVILINSNSAVDVKITWILELLLIRITIFLVLELCHSGHLAISMQQVHESTQKLYVCFVRIQNFVLGIRSCHLEAQVLI